ncbi:MAG: hydrogenase formation protein HypD [Armatimonadota bacterium]
MLNIDEFRESGLAHKIAEKISADAVRPLVFMEVCGTHTMAIARYGIKSMMPDNVKLVSGPGCPVCVTPQSQIDRFIELGRLPGVTLATFGDMVRVPGSETTLEYERAKGADIRIVYSPLDAVRIASQEPDRKIVFFGVGFETTTPSVALAVIEAREKGINNFYVMCAHKTIPEALVALFSDPELAIDGLICPGHVSAILGSEIYELLASDLHIPCVITGFEPLDILQSVHMLVRQAVDRSPKVEIQYSRVVSKTGNRAATECVYRVFESEDSEWRGIGVIPGSGLKFRPEYAEFDASRLISADFVPVKTNTVCECGLILKGRKSPSECRAYGKGCTPEHPLGPCMVSSEGACAAHYRYSI